MTPLINQHFKPYEDYIHKIVSSYPEPSIIHCHGKAQGTVRQNLRRALDIFIKNPGIDSPIPRHIAAELYRNFSFSDNPDGTIYIGPRRPRVAAKNVNLAIQTSAPSFDIPPIDCSSPVTLHAILHLKNFDHIPQVPITITNLSSLPLDLQTTYPNVELVPNPDCTYTVL